MKNTQPKSEKYFIIGYDQMVDSMMSLEGFKKTMKQDEADIVIFTGGADVDPRIYGHERHPTTQTNIFRDEMEARKYSETSNEQIKVGICRGAQLLCVLNGGTLYQDVNRHAIWETHPCSYVNEKGEISSYEVTSTHHQMQNPYIPQIGVEGDLTFDLWGYADRATYRDQDAQERLDLTSNAHPDVEIVYWPKTNSLGFQGHPEYDSKECRKLFFTCLDRALKERK